MIALCIMIVSVILHSYALIKMKHNYLFLLSGCLVIFAGLSSLTGLIIFIAAVNGAVDNKIAKNNRSRDEEPPFKYGYGISFYCAVLSFLTQEINGICNIYWYMSYNKKKRIKNKKFKLNSNRTNDTKIRSSTKRKKDSILKNNNNNNKIGNNIKIIITDESTSTNDNPSPIINEPTPELITPVDIIVEPVVAKQKEENIIKIETENLNQIQPQLTNKIQQQQQQIQHQTSSASSTDSYNESFESTPSSNYASSSSTLKVISDESNECYTHNKNEILEENELKAKFYKLDTLENSKIHSKFCKCNSNKTLSLNVRPISLIKAPPIQSYSARNRIEHRTKPEINFGMQNNYSYFVKLPVFKLNSSEIQANKRMSNKKNIPFKLISTGTILKQQQNKQHHYKILNNTKAMINATNEAAIATESYLTNKNFSRFYSNSYNFKTLPDLFLLNETSQPFQCVSSDLPINKMRNNNNNNNVNNKNSNKNHRVYRIRQRAPLLKQSSCNSTLKAADTLKSNNSYNLRFATSDCRLENNKNYSINSNLKNTINAHFKLKRTTSV